MTLLNRLRIMRAAQTDASGETFALAMTLDGKLITIGWDELIEAVEKGVGAEHRPDHLTVYPPIQRTPFVEQKSTVGKWMDGKQQ